METSINIISYFSRVVEDRRMHPSHISLYVALFQLWDTHKFQTPFRISRKEVMRLSKIRSIATYHKCIKEIQNAGFIVYTPNFNSYKGSTIKIIDPGSEYEDDNSVLYDAKTLPNADCIFSEPVLSDIELYFSERDVLSEEAIRFHLSYQSRDWRLINNKPMKCWRSAARNWISKVKNKGQNKNL